MEQELFIDAIRIIFLFVLPVMGLCLLGGLLAATLQTVTSIKEPTLGYASRLLMLVIGLYLVVPATARALIEMLVLVLK